MAREEELEPVFVGAVGRQEIQDYVIKRLKRPCAKQKNKIFHFQFYVNKRQFVKK